MIIPTAEPFFFPGGEIGCLLVHGFTGTPKEMRPLGEYLAAQGYSVAGVRLAGHATQLPDMLRVHWQDWVHSVEDGWHLLGGAARPIFVCGLSMGGILSLYFASQFPVAGVAAMSTPYALPPDPRLKYIRWLHHLQPKIEKDPSDWQDPALEAGHIDYPYYPTKAIGELAGLLEAMRANLPKIKAPVLLVHSRADRGVPPENMQKIAAALTTPRQETLLIENSGHVVVCDAARQQVFEAVSDFVRRMSAKTL